MLIAAICGEGQLVTLPFFVEASSNSKRMDFEVNLR
jgi:hypothetical protein